MTLEEIERLIRHVEQRSFPRFEYSQGRTTIRLRSTSVDAGHVASALAAVATTKAVERAAITAPAAGRFKSVHPLSTARFVAQGAAVRQGQVVAFLEVGPCLRPVTAPADGVVGAALVEEGELVGYGTQLFDLD